MDDAKRSDLAMKTGVGALAAQRNQALDACAHFQSELAVVRAELEEARAEIASLKAAGEANGDS